MTGQLLRWIAGFDTVSLRAFYGSQIDVRLLPPNQQQAFLDALAGIADRDFEVALTALVIMGFLRSALGLALTRSRRRRPCRRVGLQGPIVERREWSCGLEWLDLS